MEAADKLQPRDGRRLTMLGEAAARIAHEIKNPLVSIGGFASRIQKQLPQDHAAQSGLSIIVQEITRLEMLLKELLGLGSPGGWTGGQVELGVIVKEVLSLAQPSIQQRCVKLAVGGPPQPLMIEGNDDHLKRALLNVILNAIQAMPEGGELTLALRCTLKDAMRGVAITVQDTGTRIAPEDLPKVFEPFFTTKRSGTGLGLAVVKKAIDAHGGTVEIASRPRRGLWSQCGCPSGGKSRNPMLRGKEDFGEERRTEAGSRAETCGFGTSSPPLHRQGSEAEVALCFDLMKTCRCLP